MVDDRTRRIRTALAWISGRLEEADVPHQFAGGLAARAHGATRALHDIDVYVPEGTLARLRPLLADHHVHGPRRHRDEHWDCYFMEVRYAGEDIELAEASRTWYRRGPDAEWTAADVDFDGPAMREAFGVEIPVMPLDRLVAYKRRLGRPVDERDLAELADAPRAAEGDDPPS